MSVEQTISVLRVFPDGTEVGLYDAEGYTEFPPIPPGHELSSAVVTEGEVTFTGLEENHPYFAAAQVSGMWRSIRLVPFAKNPAPWEKREGPPGKDGEPGATGPAGLTWRGTWSSGTEYNQDDVVTHGGSSYRSKVAAVQEDQEPPDDTYWEVIAEKGDPGEEGELAEESVTFDKLALGAVTSSKLFEGAVTNKKLEAHCVSTGKIAAKAITEELLDDAAVTKEKLSLAVQEEIAAGGVPTVGCSVIKTKTQNIPNAAGTPVTWDSAAGARCYNDGACWAAANPTRFTAPEDGLYAISASLWRDDEDDADSEWGLRLCFEGKEEQAIATVNHDVENTNGRIIHLSTIVRLSAGEFVAFTVFQDSGGTRKIDIDEYGTGFSVARATFERIR